MLAHVFYSLAAASGDNRAADSVARIDEKLSGRQLKEAQALAGAWVVGTALPVGSKTGRVAAK